VLVVVKLNAIWRVSWCKSNHNYVHFAYSNTDTVIVDSYKIKSYCISYLVVATFSLAFIKSFKFQHLLNWNLSDI